MDDSARLARSGALSLPLTRRRRLQIASIRHVQSLASLVRRVLRKPPRVVARRVVAELAIEMDRLAAPRLGRRFDDRVLLEALDSTSIDELWDDLASLPYPFARSRAELERLDELCPEERPRVLAAAEDAVARRVDLLGSGLVELGDPVDWHRDPKSGRRWPATYGRRIDYVDKRDSSDVKLPWEISRLQWLLPSGQAFLLTGDERYAMSTRELLEDWIAANPHGVGVNWAIAMEPAFRVFSWVWLFHAFARSEAWSSTAFRSRFLRSLYLHAVFVDRNIEESEVNGNHYTADAAALAAAGLFFGTRGPAKGWSDGGWSRLVAELPRQIADDGVDFEASTAYHRLVAEFFLVVALLRRSAGIATPDRYRDRLLAAAAFTAAYTRPDGLAPLWGDADDARVLPLGGRSPQDHRHLAAAIGIAFDEPSLGATGGGRPETFWFLGADAAESLGEKRSPLRSAGFRKVGVYVLAHGDDHLFIDAGPVGLEGRGGHGHNDCLSFEATLAGNRLVTDCGSYVYTASFEWRNLFRGTAFHNTPQIDGIEQNRLDPANLWRLEEEARPVVVHENLEPPALSLVARHFGYCRLANAVEIERTFLLDTGIHSLAVVDRFHGTGEHEVSVPLHLAPGVETGPAEDGRCTLTVGDESFVLLWHRPEHWQLERTTGWASPTYGTREPIVRLAFKSGGQLRTLAVVIAPLARENEARPLLERPA